MKKDISSALSVVPHARLRVAVELRVMAEGAGRYVRFAGIDPWVRNVWSAAADLLEEEERF